MRVDQASAYVETRDALAQDWGDFMAAALPEHAWLPFPNVGADHAEELAERWGIDGLVLTGGNDLGSAPERDATERALLARALRLDHPVLAVCRGLQLLQASVGGPVDSCGEGHGAVEHEVSFVGSLDGVVERGTTARVNSYHRLGVAEAQLGDGLERLAVTSDGLVEAARLAGRRVVGVQWHPERGRPFRDLDVALARWVFAA